MKTKVTYLKLPNYGAIYGIILLLLVFSIMIPNFFSISNMANIVMQSSVMSIITIASFLAILTHQIDLSVGSVAALVGVIAASLQGAGMNLAVSCLIALCIGTAVGLINGLLIAFTKVDPFIITLGTMGIGESIALVISQGNTLRMESEAFAFLGQGYIWVFPVSIIITLIIYFIFSFLLTRLPYGVHLYAIGGKEEAALASGINVKRVKINVFTINALLASIAGLILASRLGSANSSQGVGLEMDGIAAAVLGGASLTGGKGRIWGVFIGSIAISILRNGLNMAGYSAALQMMLVGVIMVVIIIFDNVRSKRDEK